MRARTEPLASKCFSDSFKALEDKIRFYRETTSFIDLDEFIFTFLSHKLLKHIETTCNAVDDEKEKLIIMHYIIQERIAGINDDEFLENQGGHEWLKICLAEFMQEINIAQTTSTISNYIESSTKKMFDVFADNPSKQQLLKAARTEIPEEGYSLKLASAISDYFIDRNILDGLYSGWRLGSTQDHRPANLHGEPLKDGWYQYIIITNNETRFLPTAAIEEGGYFLPYKKYRAHRQLADGRNVYSAGAFKVENTKITKIDGWSGHYGTEDAKHPRYAKMVFACMGIDMDRAEVVDKNIFSRSIAWNRFFEKTGAFFSSCIMPGEKAEARPELPNELRHIVPKF